MNFTDSTDASIRHATAALELMKRHKIPADPNNYAVWYIFVADRMPDLTAAITEHLKSGQPFDPEINADLFERFLGTAHQEAELREVGLRIETAVSRLLDFIGSANQGVTKYGETLQTFSGELERQALPPEFARLIGTVLSDTKAMVTVNRQLEERLHSSSTEITRLRGDLEQLRREATTDPLTGLANRKLFDVGLHEAALEAEETGNPLTVLMIDIDFFKRFNDAHGHQLGDQVLKLVSRTMVDCVKGKDLAARYGGEEFSIILPGTRLKDAVTVGDSIRTAVAGKNITNRRTGQVLGKITLSVGCSEYVRAEPVGNFLHRADEALYLAKRLGRNRVMTQDDISAGQVAFEEQ